MNIFVVVLIKDTFIESFEYTVLKTDGIVGLDIIQLAHPQIIIASCLVDPINDYSRI